MRESLEKAARHNKEADYLLWCYKTELGRRYELLDAAHQEVRKQRVAIIEFLDSFLRWVFEPNEEEKQQS